MKASPLPVWIITCLGLPHGPGLAVFTGRQPGGSDLRSRRSWPALSSKPGVHLLLLGLCPQALFHTLPPSGHKVAFSTPHVLESQFPCQVIFQRGAFKSEISFSGNLCPLLMMLLPPIQSTSLEPSQFIQALGVGDGPHHVCILTWPLATQVPEAQRAADSVFGNRGALVT